MQQNKVNNNYKGIKGWLLLLCVSLTILIPISSIIFDFSTFGSLLWINRSMLSEEADIISVKIIIGCVVCFKNIISITAGISLWRKSICSVNVAKFYLIVLLLLSIISSFMPFLANIFLGFGKAIIWAIAIESTVFSIAFFTIWYLYLSKSKRIKETFPSAPNNVDFLSCKNFIKMFDKNKYKVNHYMFAGLFTIKFFTIFVLGMVVSILGRFELPIYSYQDFLIAVFIGFLYSILFILVSYLVRRDWILLIIWPLVYALLIVIHLFFNLAINYNEIVFLNTANIIDVVKNFIWELLFLTGLILAIRIWGTRFWSIIATILIFVTIAFFIGTTIGNIFRTETFYIESLIALVLNYVVEGILIFVALKFHLSDVQINREIGKKLVTN